MRRSSSLFGALLIAGLASTASAQQVPQTGCNAGVNCQPRGFSALTNLDKAHVGPGFGIRWGPGFELFIPGLESKPNTKPPSEGQFHLHMPPARNLFPDTSLTPPSPASPAIPAAEKTESAKP